MTKDAPAQAQAFVDFLRTPEAQKVFAEKGYRSILPDVLDAERYPQPATLFTIADLGGWDAITSEFFDREDGIFAGHPTRTGGATRMRLASSLVLAAALVLIPAASAQPARRYRHEAHAGRVLRPRGRPTRS